MVKCYFNCWLLNVLGVLRRIMIPIYYFDCTISIICNLYFIIWSYSLLLCLLLFVGDTVFLYKLVWLWIQGASMLASWEMRLQFPGRFTLLSCSRPARATTIVWLCLEKRKKIHSSTNYGHVKWIWEFRNWWYFDLFLITCTRVQVSMDAKIWLP